MSVSIASSAVSPRMKAQPISLSPAAQDQHQSWIRLDSQVLKVLIVEDNESQSLFLARTLGKQGFCTLQAKSGHEALQMARQHVPDLILMDVGLPDIDGLSVSNQLSEDMETSAIPIIVVSATDNDGIVRDTRRVGCLYFLRKPYDPNALLLLINETLNPSLPCLSHSVD